MTVASELSCLVCPIISTLPRCVRFMKNVKRSSLVQNLVVLSTELGGLQYRLRSIENVISGIDARADDTRRIFTDREFVRAQLALSRRNRRASMRDARLVKAQITRARSRIESISAKLERLSRRPR